MTTKALNKFNLGVELFHFLVLIVHGISSLKKCAVFSMKKYKVFSITIHSTPQLEASAAISEIVLWYATCLQHFSGGFSSSRPPVELIQKHFIVLICASILTVCMSNFISLSKGIHQSAL